MNSTEGIIKKTRMMMILEIVGKPPEHLVETLNGIVNQIKEENGVEMVYEKINEPVQMKEQNEFYTTFAEIEIEVEDISIVAGLLFKYMPSHIEVLEPESIVLKNGLWNDILNEIVRRLHGYDEVARVLQIEKEILEKKLKEVMSKKD